MIPSRWPDATLVLIDHLRAQVPGVTFTRTKRASVDQVVLDTEPGRLDTPISRGFTVLLEAWVHLPNGLGDVGESVRLMDEVLFALQQSPSHVRQVVGFDGPIGPRVVKDQLGFEYVEGSIVLTFSRS